MTLSVSSRALCSGREPASPAVRARSRVRCVCPSLHILLLPALLLLLLPHTVSSQEILLGAKIGVSFSKFSDNGPIDGDLGTLADFIGGAYGRIRWGMFGIQLEALAVTKGADYDLPGENDFEIKVDYVEVPLLAVLNFRYGRFAPYLMAGPTFAAEVRCRTEFFEDDVEVQFDCDDAEARPLIFARNTVDIGAAFGGGVMIAVGPGAALIEARYTHGLSDINDSEFDDTTIRNRSAYFMAGYAYPLRRR